LLDAASPKSILDRMRWQDANLRGSLKQEPIALQSGKRFDEMKCTDQPVTAHRQSGKRSKIVGDIVGRPPRKQQEKFLSREERQWFHRVG